VSWRSSSIDSIPPTRKLDAYKTVSSRPLVGPSTNLALSFNGIGPISWARSDSSSSNTVRPPYTLFNLILKLICIDNALSSFKKTQSLPPPNLADIHEYRGYFATHMPIVETETRFLDAEDDLVCVDDGEESDEHMAEEDTMETPMPPSYPTFESPTRPPYHSRDISSVSHITEAAPDPPDSSPYGDPDDPILMMSLAGAATVIVPAVVFATIPSYLGRITLACLIGCGVLGALSQWKTSAQYSRRDLCVYAGLYGSIMAVLAAVVGYHPFGLRG
jgi:hypothetical protein